MRLRDLNRYNPITIQCHDNPDADALASGYGLYCYFHSRGKQVRLVYSGKYRIHKSNIRLMVEKLNIPVEYVPPIEGERIHVEGLLLTVDCQYGAGNVTGLTADAIAIIDHHQQEVPDMELCEINPHLGSCSTLVWKLLTDEGYIVQDNDGLGTALYYGLYTDTGQFSEIFYPLDMDMREAVPHEESLISLFRNSNLSLQELEIAGIAMIRYSYNDDYRFAVIKSQPCDPNILGLISDFLLQVDIIDTCVVFNETGDGFKYSVRSCIREVNASELAAFLSEGIGSGGGHYDKAGGFISVKFYEDRYPTLHAEAYFNNRMVEYFDSFELIYADSYEVNLEDMELYEKKKMTVGYVEADNLLPVGTPITIRTLEGDVDLVVTDDLYIIIGIKGEVYPNHREKFLHSYRVLDEKYSVEDCTISTEYIPVLKNRANGQDMPLIDYAKKCIPSGRVQIYARPLDKGVKVFTAWDESKYMLGKPGDWLAVRSDDMRDIYVVERDIFERSYLLVESQKNLL